MSDDSTATAGPDGIRQAATLRLQDGLGFLSRVLSARANQLFEEQTRQADITARQYGALLTLFQRGALTLTELATAINVDRSTLTEMVRRMVRDGLVTRAGNGQDRRSSLIALSPAGVDAVGRLTPGAARVQDILLAGLSPADRRTLLAWVKRLARTTPAEGGG